VLGRLVPVNFGVGIVSGGSRQKIGVSNVNRPVPAPRRDPARIKVDLYHSTRKVRTSAYDGSVPDGRDNNGKENRMGLFKAGMKDLRENARVSCAAQHGG
jgi:hypothetical protein